MRADINGLPTTGLTLARLQSLFTETDYHIVRQAIAELPSTEQSVVMLRFWKNRSVVEIAELLGLTIAQVERYFYKGLQKIKSICTENPSFSRSKQTLLNEAA